MWRALPLFLLLACGNKNNPAPNEDPAPTEDVEPADGEPADGEEPADGDAGTEPVADGKPTPESLYAECKDRVEGPQKEGECTTSEDCKTAGCGSEVCTTTAEAANIMTTCEGKLCFKVLDACGCNDGQCTWSLKAELPDMSNGPKPALPPNRLPPSPPPVEDGAEGDKGAEAGAKE